MTKAAVLRSTKSVPADYVGHGIRCRVICPGTVQSPSMNGRLAATVDAFTARQPMGRIDDAAEIADLAVYLADVTYTTGQAVCIDGGWTL